MKLPNITLVPTMSLRLKEDDGSGRPYDGHPFMGPPKLQQLYTNTSGTHHYWVDVNVVPADAPDEYSLGKLLETVKTTVSGGGGPG